MPNNTLEISNEADRYDSGKDTASVVEPKVTPPEEPVAPIVVVEEDKQDTTFEIKPPAKETVDFPETPFQDLDEDEEKEEILLKEFASKMSAAAVAVAP